MGCGGRAGWFYYTAFTWIKRVWGKKTKNVWGYVWKLKFKYTRTRWRNNVHKLCEHKAFGGKFYWAKIRSSLFLFCILPFKILHSLLFMILHSYGKNAAVAGRVEFHAFNVDVARLFEGVHPDMSHWTFAPCSWIMRLASSEPAGWITSSDQTNVMFCPSGKNIV